MDMEAGKTLTNEEVIRKRLELLKKNAMKEQANDVFEICSYVDGLEKKIDSMTEELTNMQNQIKEMQEDTLVNNAKKALSEAQERLNARCEQIKSQVLEVKAQVKSTAKSIVDEAKVKGRTALYRVSEFLGIKNKLLNIRENVRGAIRTADKDIAKTALLAEIYVYEDDCTKQIDGFIGMNDNYTEGIFVKKAVQSKGIGKQLLNHAKEGKSTLRLRVYQKNKKAIQFYLREEFVIQSENIDNNTDEKEFVMVWNR